KGVHTTTPDPSLAKEGSCTVAWTCLVGGSLITIQIKYLIDACDRVLPFLDLLPSLVKEGPGVVR
ncbi:hypothetical protein, partial [Desulfonatronospira sp. MSAO_Bac3]|uniref:hypothetical protein n=1 Tax=Desulfonatronospira sp. MSAO_Bac3 TaxID=2293857 RepID=UPI000FEFA43F